jgi:hypothetical protein
MSQEQEKSTFVMVFSNPIIGCVASIVGVVLAISFFVFTRQAPELVAYVHPSKSVFVKADIPSNLSVHFNGEPIVNKDVVAIDVAIWNRGDASIRKELVLENIKIHLGPSVKVLQATIKDFSRSVTKFRVISDAEEFKNGNIPVEWLILEGGDGVNIQVIYAGSPKADFGLQGIIEGQGAPVVLSTIRTIDKYSSRKKNRKALTVSIITTIVILMCLMFSGVLRLLPTAIGKLSFMSGQPPTYEDVLASTVVLILMLAFMIAFPVALIFYQAPPLGLSPGDGFLEWMNYYFWGD